MFISDALDKLSGLHLFIVNLMYLAAGAIAFIYLVMRVVSTSNYLKEKSSFITATDAFGCGKTRILGAFTAENAMLLIPISAGSALLSNLFIKLIFRILSSYIGLEFDTTANLGSMLAALGLMLITELFILLLSFLLFRKRSND